MFRLLINLLQSGEEGKGGSYTKEKKGPAWGLNLPSKALPCPRRWKEAQEAQTGEADPSVSG